MQHPPPCLHQGIVLIMYYVVDGLRHCFDSVVDGLRHCLIDTVVDELKHCFDSVVFICRSRHCLGGG